MQVWKLMPQTVFVLLHKINIQCTLEFTNLCVFIVYYSSHVSVYMWLLYKV